MGIEYGLFMWFSTPPQIEATNYGDWVYVKLWETLAFQIMAAYFFEGVGNKGTTFLHPFVWRCMCEKFQHKFWTIVVFPDSFL